jgi:hypothetical protein
MTSIPQADANEYPETNWIGTKRIKRTSGAATKYCHRRSSDATFRINIHDEQTSKIKTPSSRRPIIAPPFAQICLESNPALALTAPAGLQGSGHISGNPEKRLRAPCGHRKCNRRSFDSVPLKRDSAQDDKQILAGGQGFPLKMTN